MMHRITCAPVVKPAEVNSSNPTQYSEEALEARLLEWFRAEMSDLSTILNGWPLISDEKIQPQLSVELLSVNNDELADIISKANDITIEGSVERMANNKFVFTCVVLIGSDSYEIKMNVEIIPS